MFGRLSARLASLGSALGLLRHLLAIALGAQFLKAELGGAAEEQLVAVHSLLLHLPPLRLLLLLLLQVQVPVVLEPLERGLLLAWLTRRQHRVHHRVDLTRSPGITGKRT